MEHVVIPLFSSRTTRDETVMSLLDRFFSVRESPDWQQRSSADQKTCAKDLPGFVLLTPPSRRELASVRLLGSGLSSQTISLEEDQGVVTERDVDCFAR